MRECGDSHEYSDSGDSVYFGHYGVSGESGGQKYTSSFFIWILRFMWDIVIFDILCGTNVGLYVRSVLEDKY